MFTVKIKEFEEAILSPEYLKYLEQLYKKAELERLNDNNNTETNININKE